MANLTKRITKSGQVRWKIEVSVKSKRICRTFGTRREALAWAREQEQLMQNKLPAATTLGQIMERYRVTVTPTKKSAVWENNKIKNLIKTYPDLFERPMRDLSRNEIAAWRDQRVRKTSSASVNREWSVLNNAVNTAITEWEIAADNPFALVKRPPESPPRERIISNREIDMILTAAGYKPEGEPSSVSQRVAAAFLFALETGMRTQEICNLTWDDINGRVAMVRTSKTRSGIRHVPLSTKALSVVEQMDGHDPEHVFGLSVSQLGSNFRRLKTLIGNPDFTFHDARATAITRLAKKLEILDLARMVGHKDLSMLMVYYRESADQMAIKLD